ncbi:MAG: hypothetical protein ACHQEB_05610, partial [Chitinophagales bacterium]
NYTITISETALLKLTTVVFILSFIIVYLLTRFFIYNRLKKMYVTINHFRKADTEELGLKEIPFSK